MLSSISRAAFRGSRNVRWAMPLRPAVVAACPMMMAMQTPATLYAARYFSQQGNEATRQAMEEYVDENADVSARRRMVRLLREEVRGMESQQSPAPAPPHGFEIEDRLGEDRVIARTSRADEEITVIFSTQMSTDDENSMESMVNQGDRAKNMDFSKLNADELFNDLTTKPFDEVAAKFKDFLSPEDMAKLKQQVGEFQEAKKEVDSATVADPNNPVSKLAPGAAASLLKADGTPVAKPQEDGEGGAVANASEPDSQNSEQQERADDTQASEQQNPEEDRTMIPFEAIFHKPEKGAACILIQATCNKAGMIDISGVSHYPDIKVAVADSSKAAFLKHSLFSTISVDVMAPELKSALLDYMRERGIDGDFAQFVAAYGEHKLLKEWTNTLNSVKDYLKRKA